MLLHWGDATVVENVRHDTIPFHICRVGSSGVGECSGCVIDLPHALDFLTRHLSFDRYEICLWGSDFGVNLHTDLIATL